MKSLMCLSRVLLLVSSLFTVAFAASDVPAEGIPAGTVLVPDGVAATDVQKAILLAGTGRGWGVKEKAADRVVLFLEQGGWRSQLVLTFDPGEIKIVSHSGKPDRKGIIKKPAIPANWVKFLKQDITKQLGISAYAK